MALGVETNVQSKLYYVRFPTFCEIESETYIQVPLTRIERHVNSITTKC